MEDKAHFPERPTGHRKGVTGSIYRKARAIIFFSSKKKHDSDKGIENEGT